MEVLKEENLMQINGGAISSGLLIGIVGGLIFIIGVVDGILRPYKCR